MIGQHVRVHLLLLLCTMMHCIAATPIAPATPDGATPIDARVSAAEFGAQDAFDAADSSAESTQAEASEAGFKVSGGQGVRCRGWCIHPRSEAGK